MSRIIQYLHRAILLQDGGGKTDGQLLECFIWTHLTAVANRLEAEIAYERANAKIATMPK
jgi:hypothetical protein